MTQPKQVTQSLNLLNAAPDMYAALVRIQAMQHAAKCDYFRYMKYHINDVCNCHRAVAAEALRKAREQIENYA